MFSGLMAFEGTRADRVAPWSAEFDAETGAMVSYTMGGKEMLKAPLMPSVTRACTENDLGAGFDKRIFAMWHFPEFKVAEFAVEAADDCCKVKVAYAPVNDVAAVTLEYKIYADGTVAGVESLVMQANWIRIRYRSFHDSECRWPWEENIQHLSSLVLDLMRTIAIERLQRLSVIIPRELRISIIMDMYALRSQAQRLS